MSDSWYTEILLRNSYLIRENTRSIYVEGLEQAESVDLENDDYNNLLLVEKTLRDLKENRQLSSKEAIILERVLQHKSLSQIQRETGMSRVVVAKFFELICDRVAFILGDVFTNDGYLDYIAERNNLTEDQIERARRYMNSNKRYYVLSKNINKPYKKDKQT